MEWQVVGYLVALYVLIIQMRTTTTRSTTISQSISLGVPLGPLKGAYGNQRVHVVYNAVQALNKLAATREGSPSIVSDSLLWGCLVQCQVPRRKQSPNCFWGTLLNVKFGSRMNPFGILKLNAMFALLFRKRTLSGGYQPMLRRSGLSAATWQHFGLNPKPETAKP